MEMFISKLQNAQVCFVFGYQGEVSPIHERRVKILSYFWQETPDVYVKGRLKLLLELCFLDHGDRNHHSGCFSHEEVSEILCQLHG